MGGGTRRRMQVEGRRALAERFGAVAVAPGDAPSAVAAATAGRGVDVAMEVR